jgi:hypothetical protein
MRAEGCRVPYVVIGGVLRVALVCGCTTVDVDGWRCSVDYCAFGDGDVAQACGAACASYGER